MVSDHCGVDYGRVVEALSKEASMKKETNK